MTDGSANPEGESRRDVVMVSLEGNQLGHEIKGEGNHFDLRHIFDPHSQLGGDRFTHVYFRTQSGNIYHLEDWGDHARLVNGNESKAKGKMVASMLPVEAMDTLLGQRLTVGEPFRYGTGVTTPITEIVPVTGRVYGEEYLRAITTKPNSISTDFKQGLPHIPRPDPLPAT